MPWLQHRKEAAAQVAADRARTHNMKLWLLPISGDRAPCAAEENPAGAATNASPAWSILGCKIAMLIERTDD
jgi:hypothetical protein